MNTTALRKKHEVAIFYCNAYDRCLQRISDFKKKIEIEDVKDPLNAYLFYPKCFYVKQIERYEQLLIFIQQRHEQLTFRG
jgi:hypothetical protein